MRRALVLLAALSSISFAQDHDHPVDAGAAVGRVSFPASCSTDVQPRIEQAVAMLHSFWFEAADQAFRRIAEADPSCAMAR